MNLRSLSFVFLICCISSTCWGQTVAYTNGTIETLGPQGTIENGTLVVRDDEVIAVGADVEIPDDARVVSLRGMTVMPGLVDPYFVFKRRGGGTRTVQFQGRTFTIPSGNGFSAGSFSRIGEYFYPYSFDFRPALRSGITTSNLVSDGQGQSAFANVVEDPSPEMIFNEEGVLFAQVTNQTTALDIVRKPLAAKKEKSSESKSTAKPATETGKKSTKQLWEAVKQGKSPLFVNVNNAAAVAHLLNFFEDQEKARLILVATGPNLYRSLTKIKANKNITVVLQPGIDRVPFKSDLMNVSRMLAEREIPFAISMSLAGSQLQASQDDPMFPLAMLVRTGLDRETTLKAVTIKPAELMGIDKTHGTLEKGKKANFLVFDGDPLETGSQLKQVILDGKLTYEN